MTPDQLLERRSFLGASEAAAAVDMSSFQTKYALWADKTSTEPPVERDTSRMEWGRRLQRAILERYAEDASEPVEMEPAPVVHPEYPWMRASPDGLTPTRVVEVKTAGIGQAREWGEADDAVPLPYLVQVTHQMIVTGRRLADIPVLIGGNEYRCYTISLDDELAQLLIQREREFWQHVQDGTPPEVRTIADAQARWPKDTGVSVVASQEIADAVVRLQEVKAEQEKLEADADALSLAIRTCMADATTLTDSNGQALATWKAQMRSQFDFSGFKAKHPGLHAEFTLKIPTRVFRLAKGKQT